MKEEFNMENEEKEYTITMTKEEYDYLILVLSNLINIEMKVPKRFKTDKSRILKALQSKLIKIDSTSIFKNKD